MTSNLFFLLLPLIKGLMTLAEEYEVTILLVKSAKTTHQNNLWEFFLRLHVNFCPWTQT